MTIKVGRKKSKVKNYNIVRQYLCFKLHPVNIVLLVKGGKNIQHSYI